MAAQKCILPFLHTLKMAFFALLLFVVNTQARIVNWDWNANNEVDDELPFPYASSPFLAKVHGGEVNFMTKYRRRRHGVYDECCSKSCTYNELLSYCL